MTYITNIPLNKYRTETRKLVSSQQVAHATVLQSFAPSQQLSGDNGRVLWRLDTDATGTFLTIVSPEKPSPEHIVENCGWAAAGTESYQQVDYTPLLNSLGAGQEYAFSLTLNPVVSSTSTNKRVAVAEDQVAQWAIEKLATEGISVHNAQVLEYGVKSFRRGSGKVTLALAKVSGVLIVNDPDSIRSALISGVGRAKGYGCGLLTLDKRLS